MNRFVSFQNLFQSLDSHATSLQPSLLWLQQNPHLRTSLGSLHSSHSQIHGIQNTTQYESIQEQNTLSEHKTPAHFNPITSNPCAHNSLFGLHQFSVPTFQEERAKARQERFSSSSTKKPQEDYSIGFASEQKCKEHKQVQAGAAFADRPLTENGPIFTEPSPVNNLHNCSSSGSDSDTQHIDQPCFSIPTPTLKESTSKKSKATLTNEPPTRRRDRVCSGKDKTELIEQRQSSSRSPMQRQSAVHTGGTQSTSLSDVVVRQDYTRAFHPENNSFSFPTHEDREYTKDKTLSSSQPHYTQMLVSSHAPLSMTNPNYNPRAQISSSNIDASTDTRFISSSKANALSSLSFSVPTPKDSDAEHMADVWAHRASHLAVYLHSKSGEANRSLPQPNNPAQNTFTMQQSYKRKFPALNDDKI